MEKVEDIVNEEAKNNIPKASRKKKTKWLSEEAINIAHRRREMKTKGASKGNVKGLNTDFYDKLRKTKISISKRHASK